jgi:hypothetical protein
MPAPPTAHRLVAFLAKWCLVLGVLACGADEAVEPDDHVAIKLAFDQVTYVEKAISQHKLLERVKNQTRSILPALRKNDVMVLGNTQIDIEPAQLKREPVTVVDPATGITRDAQRVRFHYVTLAQVPRAVADKGDMALGELHNGSGSRGDGVLVACTANGERERATLAELHTVFDATLPSCGEAMAREEASIDAARKQLKHPNREIVLAELERVYLPVAVHVKRRAQPDAGDYAVPVEGEHIENPMVRARVPGAPAGPVAAAPPSDEPPVAVWVDKEEEKGFEDSEDEAELRRQARTLYGDTGAPTAPANAVYSSSPYLQPNFAVLYIAIGAFVVLLVGKRRRKR